MSNSKQQSHHCGIETEASVEAAEKVMDGSNRTIVGLKQFRQNLQNFRLCGSNRTIVGLKRIAASVAFGTALTAAIAPLWD